jgi:hypothetical protein
MMGKRKLILDENIEIEDEKNSSKLNNHGYNSLEEAIQAGYTFSFFDKTIFRDANVKAYIYSNENSNHHNPHVHITIDKEKDFVISLIDCSLIKPDKESKLSRVATKLTFEKIQYFRKEWNASSSLLKFKVHEGNFTSDLIKKEEFSNANI